MFCSMWHRLKGFYLSSNPVTMAKAKVSQWMGQLRDMGRVLRWSLPSTEKTSWSLSWFQVAKKALPLSSVRKNPSKANAVPTTEVIKEGEQGDGLNGIRDLQQLNEESIAKIEREMQAQPPTGFISRALFYRRIYFKR
ncbi:uncharacterized protein LOC108103313 isoform X2 [Drosophila eugracilis]|uniref:uncharacterized protein LOC108103313 isoform X2 n=1 Tax=Drosophila eugracilis TaxID=29029 RepID=UPI0007E5C3ED|nr:uncharacterized protein LOC108103313 isoform X2 [Drosophila eugracilis]